MATNSRFNPVFSAFVLLPLVVAISGCGDAMSSSTNPSSNPVAARFLVANAPEPVTSVKAIRDQLLADDGPESVEAVISGKINAGDLPPFEEGKAAFALTETNGHEGDDNHDPHQCPFCSRSIEDYIAQIYFRDEAGNIIATDARELFGVKEMSKVTIEGTAKIGDNGMLHVDAKRLHLH